MNPQERHARFRRILVPVSRGAASAHGVDEAIRLARMSGAVLRFVHVDDEAPRGTVGELPGLPGAGAARVVDEACRVAARAGVAGDGVVCQCVDGAPWDLVATQARRWQADLIVFGAERAKAGGLRPGSTGAEILHASPVPVLAISGGWRLH
jgi:nucleotide-binding universal stress UspA family protein